MRKRPRRVDACGELAGVADAIAASHPDPRDFLIELGARVAGIPRGPLAVVGLLSGGRNPLRGGGFRPELRDGTRGQSRHFAGIARAATLLGPTRTEWLSVHVRRDALDSPDGRLTTLAVTFAAALLDGSLPPAQAGDWIRAHLCG